MIHGKWTAKKDKHCLIIEENNKETARAEIEAEGEKPLLTVFTGKTAEVRELMARMIYMKFKMAGVMISKEDIGFFNPTPTADGLFEMSLEQLPKKCQE